MDDGGCRMNSARGVAAVMLVLGAVACGDSGDDTDASSAGSLSTTGTTVTTADPVTVPPTTDLPATTLASGDTIVPPSTLYEMTVVDDAISPPSDEFGDSVVVALGLDDGLPRWTLQQSEQLRGVTYPVGVGDRVIVQSAWCRNNVVAALDAATGEMLWRTDPSLPVIEFNPYAATVVDDAGVLAIITGTPESVSVTGIDTSDGHVVWTTESAPDHGFMLTESRSIIAGWSPPRGTLWVLDRGDGSTLWSIAVGEPLTAGDQAPVFPYAAADDERLYVIVGETMTTYEATTGEPLWSVSDPAWAFPPSPAAADSGVVVTGSQEGIVAYDAASGDELWRRDDPSAAGSINATSIADGHLYLNTGSGFAALDITTGEIKWDTSTGETFSTAPGSTPTMTFGTDLVAAGNGRVLVYAGAGLQLLDAASGEVLWGPNPAPLASRFTTIGPDAVLIGNTCGGD